MTLKNDYQEAMHMLCVILLGTTHVAQHFADGGTVPPEALPKLREGFEGISGLIEGMVEIFDLEPIDQNMPLGEMLAVAAQLQLAMDRRESGD